MSDGGSRIDIGSGEAMHALATELFPICRSITGEGVRETLRRLSTRIPMELVEIPTGTTVFDWTVPREWTIRDAYIKNAIGERIVDFRRSNLHVMSYSTPIHARLSRAELRPHLFSNEAQPESIPYRTSYYQENWGFCLPHEQLVSFEDGTYEVCIDSTLADGSLTYGECFLPGDESDEVLVSCHVCHPSLANDNLSGISVATALAHALHTRQRRYSYRFLFIPGTIGAIAWLATNREKTTRIKHGLVLTCVGDPGRFHYKKSRRGNADIDRAVTHVLRQQTPAGEVLDFSPYGYDERQYCSPGFNLPVGCLMRSVWGQFPEYHSSADNLTLITPEALAGSLSVCEQVVEILEHNCTLTSTNPYCEPALGKRGLYRATGGSHVGDRNMARLWVLNFSDGQHDLLDIAERSALPFSVIHAAAAELEAHGLLRR